MYIYMQVGDFKRHMKIPEIKKTPGDFDGAQFDFEELLHLVATEEVCGI